MLTKDVSFEQLGPDWQEFTVHLKTLGSLAMCRAASKKNDQTVHMLIWVCTGPSCHNLQNLMSQLIYACTAFISWEYYRISILEKDWLDDFLLSHLINIVLSNHIFSYFILYEWEVFCSTYMGTLWDWNIETDKFQNFWFLFFWGFFCCCSFFFFFFSFFFSNYTSKWFLLCEYEAFGAYLYSRKL